MNLKGIFKIIASLLLIVFVSGCGDGNSETNGTLTLNDTGTGAANGVVSINVSALLIPVQVGSDINFSATMYGTNAAGQIETVATAGATKYTDSTGTAPWTHNLPQSTTLNTTLEISATAGGLSNTLRFDIPKFVAP